MRRYQIVAIYPEGEQPSFHVYDNGLQLEVAILPSVEQALMFRQIRESVDGIEPEKLQLN